MNKDTIANVAKVLEEWNPLGERAKAIKDLDGYRVEAIDILSTLGLHYRNNVEKAVSDILSQAFDINLDDDEVRLAAQKIKKILDH